MGLFDVLKKNKELSPEEKVDRMWELWEKGKLKSPCAKLMTYESEVNNGGHNQYFFNLANSGKLKAEVECILPILPECLRKNLERGYSAFAAQEDIADDDNEELFEECDDVFYEHEQLIIDMIYEAAQNVAL